MVFSTYNKLSLYIKRHIKSLLPFLTVSKSFNILHSLFEMITRQETCLSKPSIYRIDPCSLCNLRCPSCTAHQIKTTQGRMMGFEDYKKVIDHIQSYALRISLYDKGEPLLNKAIYDMIKYTSDQHISTLISTNFNLFSQNHLAALFDSKLTILEPCLDGFTQASYEKYRQKGDVETVKNGIQMVMEHKKRLKAKWPIVDVQIVLFDHIRHEIPDINKFLAECKVDHITYRQDNHGINSQSANTPRKRNRRKSAPLCYWLYLGMAIAPNGDVFPCCGRGFDRLSYGNIFAQNLADIWNNKYYRFSRALFQKGADLEYNEEMLSIPCLNCSAFKKQRTMSSL